MILESKVNEFISLIIAYHKTIYEGDSKKTRKIYALLEICICDIKQIQGWQSTIKELLSHDNIYVKTEAACLLLPFDEKHAVWTLRKCCLCPGIEGLNAQNILREWKAKRLKSPEYEQGKVVYKQVKPYLKHPEMH